MVCFEFCFLGLFVLFVGLLFTVVVRCFGVLVWVGFVVCFVVGLIVGCVGWGLGWGLFELVCGLILVVGGF